MADFLDVLALDAIKTIEEGYYRITSKRDLQPASLKESILEFNHTPIICEVKKASPTLGIIRENLDVDSIVISLRDGGAVAISVLTEPKHFKGSTRSFMKARKIVDLPLLMKDIIISRTQIDTASAIGADAVLLIKTLFDRGYCECNTSDMIEYAHSKCIEVLLEVHTREEFTHSLSTEADLIGINNRDLKTLKVDINNTKKILGKKEVEDKIIVSESGIGNPHDIRLLRSAGARAFLIGSALMRAGDIEGKVRELVMAL